VGHTHRIDAAAAVKEIGGRSCSKFSTFVATLVEVTGLVIYFSFAYIFLEGILFVKGACFWKYPRQ
jgi:hypothetical protein